MNDKELQEKRERIRSKIELFVDKKWASDAWLTANEISFGVMECLAKEGVKIVDEKAELPAQEYGTMDTNPFYSVNIVASGKDLGVMETMKKAGFRKVYSLVEGK